MKLRFFAVLFFVQGMMTVEGEGKGKSLGRQKEASVSQGLRKKAKKEPPASAALPTKNSDVSACSIKNPCPMNSECKPLAETNDLGVDLECTCLEGFYASDDFGLYGPMSCETKPYGPPPPVIEIEFECPKNPCPEHSECRVLEKPSVVSGEFLECVCAEGFYPGDIYNAYGPMECYNFPLFQLIPSKDLIIINFVNEESDATATITLAENGGEILASRSCDTARCKIHFEHEGLMSCNSLQVFVEHGSSNSFKDPSVLEVMFNHQTVIQEIATAQAPLQAKMYKPLDCPTYN